MRAGWGVLALAIGATSWPALRGTDEVAAAALWRAAREEAPEDPAASIWVDAARINASIAPWQEDWSAARARVREVAVRRRALLPHDRGGRRRVLP